MDKDLRKSIVGILSKSSSHKYAGTGFFVEGGLILTCAHVVDGARVADGKLRFCIEGTDKWQDAEIIFKSEIDKPDIAVLRPLDQSQPAPGLPLVESRQSEGHAFTSFGYPAEGGGQGLRGDGTIDGWVRDTLGREALQISSTKITHGFSGCPLWDEAAGGVVGMVSSGFDFGLDKKLGEVAFAVPSETIKAAHPALTLRSTAKPSPAAPHQLPAPPTDFVGRADELAQILGRERTAISGLSGLGGVGKTALGLVAAWKLAERYPDAQLFIDLRGASKEPLAPADALRQVIRAFEPTADLRPYDEPQLQALYCSLLNGKRALLFLDNAHSAAQVRPLLPPPGCGVLVTSRVNFSLPGMAAPLRLDTLPEPEAVLLLTTISPRTTQYAINIAHLCGYLPLALRIAATFLTEHPDWTPAEYVERLQKQRLKTLKTEGDPAQDVEAVFVLSYAQLTPDEQQKWLALSVFTAPFTRAALAAVCSLDPDPARDLAAKLHRMSLLEYSPPLPMGEGLGVRVGESPGRYHLHDLLRDFAAARLELPQAFEAHRNHAEFFLQIAAQADDLYLAGGENILRGLDLFDNEWTHIQAAQIWAADNLEHGATELAMSLPGMGAHLLNLRLPPRQKIGWLETALRAARFLKNKKHEYAHLGNLGLAYAALGETRCAIKYHEQALVIDREIGDRRGEGQDLGNLGLAYAALGETRRAIEYHEQALKVMQGIGDKRTTGSILGNLGNAYAALGETRRAIEFYEQQLAIAREIGDLHGEGNALNNLGSAYRDLGDSAHARQLGQQALEILVAIEDPNAEMVRKWLEKLTEDGGR